MDRETIPFSDDRAKEPLPPAEIEDLAQRIRAAREAFEAAHRTCLERARDCGQLLADVKALHKHGGWMAWLKANVPFSVRTAQYYIKIAERWDDIAAKNATVAYLTLRMALESLKEAPCAGPAEFVTCPPTDRQERFEEFWKSLVETDMKWRKRYERVVAARLLAKDLARQLEDIREKERDASFKAHKLERKVTAELNALFDRQQADATEPSDGAPELTVQSEAGMSCTA